MIGFARHCRICEAAAALHPQVQLAARVSMCSWLAHTQNADIHIYIAGYTDQHRQKTPITHTNMNCTDGPALFLLFCWSGLKSTSGVCAHVYAHTVWIPPAAGAGCSVHPLTLLALGPMSLSQ